MTFFYDGHIINPLVRLEKVAFIIAVETGSTPHDYLMSQVGGMLMEKKMYKPPDFSDQEKVDAWIDGLIANVKKKQNEHDEELL
jgi:hypothetical protein